MQNLAWSRRFALAFLALFAAASYGQHSEPDWLILPGERVGPITTATSEASLEALFGAGQVRRADVYIGERSTTPGTAIYPDDTERRIEIIWSDAARTVPREIRLTGNSSKWRTAEGICSGGGDSQRNPTGRLMVVRLAPQDTNRARGAAGSTTK